MMTDVILLIKAVVKSLLLLSLFMAVFASLIFAAYINGTHKERPVYHKEITGRLKKG